MNPAQNAPLTRSPRGDDGDDGDGAGSSAWVEDKKQGAAMSSEAAAKAGVRGGGGLRLSVSALMD
jgi:hypothetical protein